METIFLFAKALPLFISSIFVYYNSVTPSLTDVFFVSYKKDFLIRLLQYFKKLHDLDYNKSNCCQISEGQIAANVTLKLYFDYLMES